MEAQALFEIGCSAHSKIARSPRCCSRGAFARRTKGLEHLFHQGTAAVASPELLGVGGGSKM